MKRTCSFTDDISRNLALIMFLHLDRLLSTKHDPRTMTNNHPLLSLYENPLAAGTIADDGHGKTAGDDRLVSYLIRSAKDESTTELAPVASLPHVPPRADAAFAPVASLPHVPPRADATFAPVASLPHVPPRADTTFAPVASLPHVPPRADTAFAPVASIPSLPPRA